MVTEDDIPTRPRNQKARDTANFLSRFPPRLAKRGFFKTFWAWLFGEP